MMIVICHHLKFSVRTQFASSRQFSFLCDWHMTEPAACSLSFECRNCDKHLFSGVADLLICAKLKTQKQLAFTVKTCKCKWWKRGQVWVISMPSSQSIRSKCSIRTLCVFSSNFIFYLQASHEADLILYVRDSKVADWARLAGWQTLYQSTEGMLLTLSLEFELSLSRSLNTSLMLYFQSIDGADGP